MYILWFISTTLHSGAPRSEVRFRQPNQQVVHNRSHLTTTEGTLTRDVPPLFFSMVHWCSNFAFILHIMYLSPPPPPSRTSGSGWGGGGSNPVVRVVSGHTREAVDFFREYCGISQTSLKDVNKWIVLPFIQYTHALNLSRSHSLKGPCHNIRSNIQYQL